MLGGVNYGSTLNRIKGIRVFSVDGGKLQF